MWRGAIVCAGVMAWTGCAELLGLDEYRIRDGGMAADAGAPTDGGTPTDAGPPIDAGPAICVERAPSGWDGPLVVYEGPAGDLPPACGGAFPMALYMLNGDLDAGTADCQCDCGEPIGGTCRPLQLDRYSNPTCSGTALMTQVGGTLDPEECVILGMQPFEAGNFRASAGGVLTAPSCDGVLTETIPEPTWQTRVQVCSGTLAMGACAASEVAVPENPGAFRGYCVAAPGDVACPMGPYTDRSVYFDDVEDDRQCGSCDCAPPTGACGGAVEIREGGCAGTLIDSIAPAMCGSESVANRYIAIRHVPGYGTCGTATSTLTGDARGTGPVTVCCTP